jgi:hypothetical protein
VSRRDYDEAGCAHGCRDTLAAGLLIGLLAVFAIRAVVRRG